MVKHSWITAVASLSLVVGAVVVAPLVGQTAAGAAGGPEWQVSAQYPSGTLPQAVSCPTTVDCVAVGGDDVGNGFIAATTDGGTTWTDKTIPAGVDALDGVACPSVADCYAVGYGAILLSTNGGVTWSSASIPSGVDALGAVACAGTTDCTAVGVGGLILATTDGVTWNAQAAPAGVNELDGVACPSVSACTAVGDGGGAGLAVTTSDGGGTWSDASVPTGVTGLGGVACPSVSDCTAVGYSYDAGDGTDAGVALSSTDGGAGWAPQTLPDGVSSLAGIACSSTSRCTAVGNGGTDGGTASAVATNDGGSTWAVQALPSEVDDLTGATCPSVLDCYAVGQFSSPPQDGGVILGLKLPSVASTDLPSATVGTAYAEALAVSGGIAPYTWSIVSGVLPAGLGLTPSTGVVAGTPTAAGTLSVVVGVTDADGVTASGTVTISVEAPGPYTPLAPVRICDTRSGDPSGLSGAAAQCDGAGGAGMRLSPGVPLVVTVAGQFGVPAGATAATLNVTAIGATGPGYLSVYPAGDGPPTASNLNVPAGRTVPDLVEAAIGTSGRISIVSNTSVDVAVDLEGFFTPADRSGAGLYDPLAVPARICDTRPGNPSGLTGGAAQCDGPGDVGSPLSPGSPSTVTVAGVGGVPAAGVSAVVLNVTVVGPGGAGYLTAYPAGGSVPTASNLNYATGETVPNRVVVPVSTLGQVSLVANRATNVVVDVSGWYSAAGGTGARYTPDAPPVRICDTRPGDPSGLTGTAAQCDGTDGVGTAIGPTATRTIDVTGLAGVPGDATAVVLDVAAVQPDAPTYLTVFPSGTPPPVSDLNPVPGETEANLVVAAVSPSGTVSLYNNSGTVNVVVDVAGWYS